MEKTLKRYEEAAKNDPEVSKLYEKAREIQSSAFYASKRIVKALLEKGLDSQIYAKENRDIRLTPYDEVRLFLEHVDALEIQRSSPQRLRRRGLQRSKGDQYKDIAFKKDYEKIRDLFKPPSARPPNVYPDCQQAVHPISSGPIQIVHSKRR